MNRLLLILFLGLLSTANVFARETVKGVVVDSKGEPIPGVKVEIPGSSEFTYTDLDGAFQIILRDPVKNLNFTYPGFGKTTHRVKPEMRIVMGKGWNGRTKGFRGMFDIEGGMGVRGKTTFQSGSNVAKDIHTFVLPGETLTLGYQFNSHLFVGAGFGMYLDITQHIEIERYRDSYSNWRNTRFSGGYFPLFLSARWDLGLTKKTAPYVGLRVGYMYYLPEDPDYEFINVRSYDGINYSRLYVYGKHCGSIFFCPSVGYRMTARKKTGINIGLSYLAGMKKKYYVESGYGDNIFSSTEITERGSDVIMFNIGFDF